MFPQNLPVIHHFNTIDKILKTSFYSGTKGKMDTIDEMSIIYSIARKQIGG